MPRDPNKAKEALERKQAKREQRQELKSLARHTVPGWIERAAGWPFYEVLLSQSWDKQGGLAGILIARVSPEGKVAAGSFLVDLACLGVKSATVRLFKTPRDYTQEMRQKIIRPQPMLAADVNLVAKILDAGFAYARELGFDPDPSYYQGRQLIADADPGLSSIQIPLGGLEGKPFFVAGPYDDVPRIMAKLTSAVGPGGFHYIAPVDPATELFLADDTEWLLEEGEDKPG